jgi:type II secretory pathway predicted ATPase ExeA
MFLGYYNLLEQPFGVTPDTRFLYLNHMYREALASLWYGVSEGRGFMGLIADPGMGKTTLLFQLLQRLRRTSARTVFLFQTCCDSSDLIRYLLQDLGISPAPDVASMHHQLNDALVREARAGRQFVLVIDEAQNLSEPVLESIRLLSDFETSQGKLLQIILAGQRQLIGTLMKPGMLQLTQRISVANFLDPLDAEEVTHYIRHRLGVAGYQGKPLFTTEALQLVAEESNGIPRNINNICFGALSTAFALDKKRIDRKIIEEVAGEQSVRSLAKRMQVSSTPRTQPESPSGFNVETKPAPKFTWRKVFRSGSLSKHVRDTACLLIVLLVMTSGAAISRRPELAVQVFAGVTDANLKVDPQEVTSPAQHAPPVIISPATPNTLPAAFLRDQVAIVEPGQTLRQICLRHLGRYSLRLVQHIEVLNPGLDPNHIEVGERIRLSFPVQDSIHVLRDEPKPAPIARSGGKGI